MAALGHCPGSWHLCRRSWEHELPKCTRQIKRFEFSLCGMVRGMMSCIVGTALAQFPPLNCLCPTLALEVKWGEKSVWIMKYFQGNEILIFLNTAVFSDQIRMLCPSRVSRQKRPVVITRTVCSVRPKGQVLQCSFCSIIYLCNHLEQNLNCTPY
jgi:hypothetical protein